MPSERIAILVDGSNFYHYLREMNLGGLSGFDYRSFAQFLAQGRTAISTTYYIGKVRSRGDAKSEKLRQDQLRFVNHLYNAGWHVQYGQMMHINGVFQEKGVDVHMAVDLVAGAYENLYDTALLVSSDTDLLPAVRKVQSKNKIVEYIGFAHRPTSGMMKNATRYKLLDWRDLKKLLEIN